MGFHGGMLVAYIVGVLVLVALSETALHNTRGERDPWGWLVPIWWMGFPVVWLGLSTL